MDKNELINRLTALLSKQDRRDQFNAENLHTLAEASIALLEEGGGASIADVPMEVETIEPNETPEAVMRGETLVFRIPQGEQGEEGPTGPQGADGKSAYQVWLDDNGWTAEQHPVSEYINSLKAHVAGFKSVSYDENAPTTIGDTASAIGSLSPSADTMDKIVLMPNSDGTATIMYATTATESEGTTTYAFSCIGELDIDTSNFLSSDKIVQDLNTGGSDKVPSAAAVKELKEDLYGETTVSEGEAQTLVEDNASKYSALSPSTNGTYIFYQEEGYTVRTLSLELEQGWKKLKVTAQTPQSGTASLKDTWVVFLKKKITERGSYQFDSLNGNGYICSTETQRSDVFHYIENGTTEIIDIPSDAVIAYFAKRKYGDNNTDRTPASVVPVVESKTDGVLDELRELATQSHVEIVDNLVTDNATKALSAKQGKVIADLCLEYVESDNILNPEDITTGKFMRKDTGNESSGSLSGTYGHTDYIPLNGGSVVCNAAIGLVGTNGCSYVIYNASKQKVFVPATQTNVVNYDNKPEGADWSYVVFNLASSAAQHWVNRGTTLKEYSEWHEPTLQMKQNGEERGDSYSEGVEIVLPSTIYCVKGDYLFLYWRSFLKAVIPAMYDCTFDNGSGGSVRMRSYSKFVRLDNTITDNQKSIPLVVRDNKRRVIASKTVIVKYLTAPADPDEPVNIMLFGASRQANGVSSVELYKRLTGDTDGTATTNIKMIGPYGVSGKDPSTNQDYPTALKNKVKHYAYQGRSMNDLCKSSGTNGYNFDIEGGAITINADDVYKDNYSETRRWTVIGADADAGNVQMKLTTADASNPLGETGTLTLDSGSGASQITYTAWNSIDSNPFWYNGAVDWVHFAENCDYLPTGEKVDIIILARVFNDWNTAKHDNDQILADYKTFIDAFHAYNPQGKVVIDLAPNVTNADGLAEEYNSGKPGATYYYSICRMFEMHKKWIDFAESDDYKDFVVLSNTSAEFDTDYFQVKSSPYVRVRNRGAKTEQLATQGVHYNEFGKQAVADSWYHAVAKCLYDLEAEANS